MAKVVSYRDGLGRDPGTRALGREREPGSPCPDHAARDRLQGLQGVVLGRRRRVRKPGTIYAAGEAFVDYGVTTIPETRGAVADLRQSARLILAPATRSTLVQLVPVHWGGAPRHRDELPLRLVPLRRFPPRHGDPLYHALGHAAGALRRTLRSHGNHATGFRDARRTVGQRASSSGRSTGMGTIPGSSATQWAGRSLPGAKAHHGRSQRRPRVSTISYNRAGQVKETWDANYPNVSGPNLYYDDGRLYRVTTDYGTGEGLIYVYGSLGRLTGDSGGDLLRVGGKIVVAEPLRCPLPQ